MRDLAPTLVYNRKSNNILETRLYFSSPKKKAMYLSTGIKLNDGEFNDNLRVISPSARNYRNKVKAVNTHLHNIMEIITRMENDGMPIRPDTFRHLYKKKKDMENDQELDLYLFAVNEMENSNELSASTKISYMATINILPHFKPRILFSEIDYQFAVDFDRYLRDRYGNLNTIHKHHVVIGKYIKLAAGKGLISKEKLMNYLMFKPAFQDVNKVILTKEDIYRIEDTSYDFYDDKFKRLFIVRDMFLFAFYSALRVSDILDLRPENFERRGDDLILRKKIVKLRKFNRMVEINLSKSFGGAGDDLIRPYLGNSPYIFPRYTNMQLYHTLSKVIKDAEIEKEVSFHTARHSALTMIALNTGDVFKVMLYGGITNIKTAQRYIHISNKVFGNQEINW